VGGEEGWVWVIYMSFFFFIVAPAPASFRVVVLPTDTPILKTGKSIF